MTQAGWQLQTPVSAIIFDVDGTLSKLEGINYIAELNGVGDKVEALTSKAMGKTGIYPELYQQRLELTQPRKEQVLALGEEYFIQRSEDVAEVIHIFLRLNKTPYMLTAGLYPAVARFANKLQISAKNIYAVNVEFDESGCYRDFDHSSPLINNDGKRIIAEQLKKQHQRILHIGDGLNDLTTMEIVSRFVGFGGVYFRENMEAKCQFYIKAASLAALLPLSLTEQECRLLTSEEQALHQKGVALIESGKVKIDVASKR